MEIAGPVRYSSSGPSYSSSGPSYSSSDPSYGAAPVRPTGILIAVIIAIIILIVVIVALVATRNKTRITNGNLQQKSRNLSGKKLARGQESTIGVLGGAIRPYFGLTPRWSDQHMSELHDVWNERLLGQAQPRLPARVRLKSIVNGLYLRSSATEQVCLVPQSPGGAPSGVSLAKYVFVDGTRDDGSAVIWNVGRCANCPTSPNDYLQSNYFFYQVENGVPQLLAAEDFSPPQGFALWSKPDMTLPSAEDAVPFDPNYFFHVVRYEREGTSGLFYIQTLNNTGIPQAYMLLSPFRGVSCAAPSSQNISSMPDPSAAVNYYALWMIEAV